MVRYGDTDSIFPDFGPLFIEEIVKLLKKAAVLINAQLPEFMEISVETIWRKWCWYKKKKYIGKNA